MFLALLAARPVEAVEILSGAPDGFEQLDAPRPTAVTLYYGGDVIGSFASHMTPGTLRFDRPEDIIAGLGTLTTPDKVTDILGQPMPTHPELLCTQKRTENCGRLEPEIAGVIFQEEELSAELFINPQYLAISDNDAKKFLPLPQRRFSSLYAFSGALSGSGTAAPNFTLSSNAMLSMGEFSLTTQATVADEGLRLDTAALTAERRGWNATAGLFRSRGMRTLPDRDIAGVSLATSRRTHLNPTRSAGNAIILFLPRRSFVSIYREGRLYSARGYEAGNQQIDTSELPDGAYPVTIKIQEPDGGTRQEVRFFAKTEELPPTGAPVYFMQAGLIRENADDDSVLPQVTGDPLLRLGTVRRLTDGVGVALGLTGLRDRGLAEAGLFWLTPGRQVRLTGMASTRGDAGLQAGYQQQSGRFYLTADALKLWLAPPPMPGFGELSGGTLQGALTASYLLTPDMTVGARASYFSQGDAPAVMTSGPYAEWRIWQRDENNLVLNASATRTNDENEGQVVLSYTRRLGRGYGVTAMGRYGLGGNGGPGAAVRGWYDGNNGRGDEFLVGVGGGMDRDSRILSGDLNWRNGLGEADAALQYADGEGGAAVSYGGSFSTRLAQVDDHLQLGGLQTDASVAMVQIDGKVDNEMAVYINGVKKGRVRVGRRQAFYLTPFHTYTIRIAPEKRDLIDYDSADRKITLYPGNVVKLDWTVSRFFVIAGRIVNQAGQPVANAVLQESRAPVSSDDNGRLQAELPEPKALTFTTVAGTCRVILPLVEPRNGALIYREPLVCRPL